jgi:FKBP-type peptidyl-prolyl cis-trans isomerase FklB
MRPPISSHSRSPMKTLAVSTLLIATLMGSLTTLAADPAAKPSAPAAAPATPAAPVTPAAPAPLDNTQASYRVGLSIGESLLKAGVAPDALKPEEVARGVREAMHGTAKLTPEEGKRLNDWVVKARGAIGERNHAAAKAFLDKNGKGPGVVTTASGLEYKIITPGTGAQPKPADEVTVQYRGTLLDGTEFDSSYKRGIPATFRADGVIKGWQEALALMQPGAKWKLFIPPALAYDLNSPPGIPPGSALIFEIELISVKPAP